MAGSSALNLPTLPYSQVCGDSGSDPIWLNAHLISSARNEDWHKLRYPSTIKWEKTSNSHLCGFCRACFHPLPQVGETKSTARWAGLRGLEKSASTCLLCNFYWRLIVNRCGGQKVCGSHDFRVYVRIPKRRASHIHPIVDVGLMIQELVENCGSGKGHIYWPKILAFCPEQNELSRRAIWTPNWHVKLSERAVLFRKWLLECKTNHHACSQNVLRGGPTRLLLIDSSTAPNTVRLVNSSKVKDNCEYAALSHCWSTSGSPLMTKSENLKEFRKAIPRSRLSKTFCDAIAIATALHISLLWIDSLCIIQDSKHDWETESAKMGAIYENAVVTLAAASSPDSPTQFSSRLQQPATLRMTLPASKDQDGGIKGVLRAAVANPFAIPSCHLNTRGWVLQEVTLSRRILYFTDHQVYWQCRTIAESEDGTLYHSIDHPSCSVRDHMNNNRLLLLPNAVPAAHLTRVWGTWTMDYSGREFTKDADRLYALAGISQFFCEYAGADALVLGLLRNRLLIDLIWQTRLDSSAPRIRNVGLPSWTWLSRKAKLMDIDFELVSRTYGWHLSRTTILGIDIEWQGKPLTSPLLKAEISISGRFLPMLVQNMRTDSSSDHKTRSVKLAPYNMQNLRMIESRSMFDYDMLEFPNFRLIEGCEVVGMFDDDMLELPNLVWCLEMLASPNGIYRFLMLKLVDEESAVYERLGTGIVRYKTKPEPGESVFGRCEEFDIVLV